MRQFRSYLSFIKKFRVFFSFPPFFILLIPLPNLFLESLSKIKESFSSYETEDSSALVLSAALQETPKASTYQSPTALDPPVPDPYPHLARQNFSPKELYLYYLGASAKTCEPSDYINLGTVIGPNIQPNRFMPMLQLNGYRFNNGKYAGNLGIGFRFVPKAKETYFMPGLNLFYDFTQGNLGSFSRLGAGFELIGRRVDLGINGYFPISNTKRTDRCVFDHYVGGYWLMHRTIETTAAGMNFLVGYYPVQSQNFSLYLSVAPYFFGQDMDGHSRGGALFHIRPQYSNYFAFDFNFLKDNVVPSAFQIGVIFFIPLYQLANSSNVKTPNGIYPRQVYQPTERFNVIGLEEKGRWFTNF